MLGMILVSLNLLRLILWPNSLSILENLSCTLEKMYILLLLWHVLYRSIKYICFNVHLLISLDDPANKVGGSFTFIIKLSICLYVLIFALCIYRYFYYWSLVSQCVNSLRVSFIFPVVIKFPWAYFTSTFKARMF